MRKRRSLKPLLFLIFLVLTGLFIGRLYYNSLLSPLDSSKTERVLFVIPPGQSTATIAARLEEDGFIRSSSAFKFLASRTGQGDKIQAGDFKLAPSMSASEILTELTVGVVDKWVTLIEGWRVEEVAEKLNKELGVDPNQFLKVAKEGYMFPDTYLVDPKITASDMAGILKNTFDTRYTDELKAQVKANGLTPEQGVILASIVEREARSDKVRTEVASILLKRIKIGMKLDADATVQYALGYQPSEKSWWKKSLTYDDLKVVSKYNTYTNPGLPPAPICNPSLSSLQAVANAHSTPYLYYFHDTKGNSYYATTLEEHNENAAKYR
jgi:UPF0755 protein